MGNYRIPIHAFTDNNISRHINCHDVAEYVQKWKRTVKAVVWLFKFHSLFKTGILRIAMHAFTDNAVL